MISIEQKLQTQIEDLKRRVRDLERAGGRASLGSIGGDVDWSLDDFGYELKADNTVTISGGVVSLDDIDLPADVEGDDFQLPIPADEDETYFVWLDVNKVAVTTEGTSSVTAILAGGLVVPTDAEQHIYITLYEFKSAAVDPEHPDEIPSGIPTLVQRCWIGSYVSQIPAWPEGETPRHLKWIKIDVCVDGDDQVMWVLGTDPYVE